MSESTPDDGTRKPDPECCWWCKFWMPDGFDLGATDFGNCRRHAPQPWTRWEVDQMETASPFEHRKFMMGTTWPNTHWEDWCGEFVPHATRRLLDPDPEPHS